MQGLYKMKYILIFFLFLPIVTSSDYHYYLTTGQGDARYCMQFGTCTLSNLSVIGGYFNVSVINVNVTGDYHVSGNVTANGYCDTSGLCYSVADLVPYNGATADVDLGNHNIKTTGKGYFGTTYKASLGGTGFSAGYFEGTDVLAVIAAANEAGYFQDSSSGNNVALANDIYAIEASGNVTLGAGSLLTTGTGQFASMNVSGSIAVNGSSVCTAANGLCGSSGSGLVSKEIILNNPSGISNATIIRMPYNAIVLEAHFLCIGGTNITGMIDMYNATGGNRVPLHADREFIANRQYNQSINVNLNESQYLGWHTAETNGIITRLIVSIDYEAT